MKGKFILITISLLAIMISCFSIKLEYVGIFEKSILLRIITNHRVRFFKIENEIYIPRLDGISDGNYIYALKINLDEIRTFMLKITAYEDPSIKEEIVVNLPKFDKVRKHPLPFSLIILGSNEFRKIVKNSIGDEFYRVSFEIKGEVSKYAVIFVENIQIEQLQNFLCNLSRKFMFFSLVGFTQSISKPVILDLSKVPTNCSFIILDTPIDFDLKHFMKNMMNLDFDEDGWIEVEEIARLVNPIVYDGRYKIPVLRSRIFPLPDRNLILQKISILIMRGMLKPSDARLCMKETEELISPPWLMEFILGKLSLEELRNIPRFLW